ncbi:hypothetical protein FHT60_003550 [Novosphingobium sp. BK486]|uniref:hypothetical protein n=1 Tax=unclassified Novosphingobium TaxID=2644732 RepID=UPI00161F13B8|nr:MULTISPECIES: hypothetical protein [unclassified Novosphingobium]MBB3359561.1 hypothetical protein [Novosphingobium sp. BK256]MBB3502508.1 hypothetical protein [Novosphingobium sp. BK336]MBB3538447.1 hypothetical protein [Novosphingobium sp. BK486]MBB3380333.1 hypothetical protein [Novosphingobium sp. BK258]MBB3450838.1 hypothetical protein [Novosphingobium sp. BK352]
MKLPQHRDDEPEWIQVQRRRMFNDSGREIWFARVMWSYMPAHWKGVVYPVASIATVAPLCIFLSKQYGDFGFVPLILAWAYLMWFCERHSPTRH